MPQDARSRQAVGVTFALLSALGFSWKAILAKLAYRTGVGPSALVGMRLGFSLPAYAGLAWVGARRREAPLAAKDWGRAALLGLGGYYVATYLDMLALKYISAGLERVILFLHPAIVVLVAARLHGRGVSRREILAMALGYAGIALVFHSELGAVQGSRGAWLGAGAVFAGSIAYALYLAFSESAVKHLGSTLYTGLTMTIACTFAVAQSVAALWGGPPPPLEAALLCLAIAVVATVLPTWLLNESIQRLGAGRAAMLGMTGPIATVVLEAVVLGEPATAMDLAGTALAIAGVYVLTSRGAAG